MIPCDCYMSFEKFGGLPAVEAYEKINFQGREKLIFQIMIPNEFDEMPHTIGCKTPLGTVCKKQLQSDGAIFNRWDIDHSNCV